MNLPRACLLVSDPITKLLRFATRGIVRHAFAMMFFRAFSNSHGYPRSVPDDRRSFGRFGFLAAEDFLGVETAQLHRQGFGELESG